MKKYLLLGFAISLNCSAGYMSQSDLESCENSRTNYTRKSKCEASEGASCFEVPSGYECAYHRVTAQDEDDLSSPIFTKSEVEACADQDDCDSMHAAKSCTDTEETAIKNYDSLEVYCSKDSGTFNQKSVTKAREDASLKSSHNASEAAKTAAEDAKMNALRAVKAKLESNAPLSDVDRDKVIEHLLRQIE